MGKSTFWVTSETKVLKAGNPGILEDGGVGDQASGSYRKLEGGKLVALKITFAPRSANKQEAGAKTNKKVTAD